MSKKLLLVFAIWHLLGAVGFLLWDRPQSTAILWVMGFILLLPGNLVASNLVSGLFWRSALSLQAMSVVSLVLAIGINFACWYAVARVFRRWRRRTGGTAR